MDEGLATFIADPAFTLSLLVGAFHTCIYIFVRGRLGWHLPIVLVGAILGALAGQAIGARVGDVLRIGDYTLLWASALAWLGIGIAVVSGGVDRAKTAPGVTRWRDPSPSGLRRGEEPRSEASGRASPRQGAGRPHHARGPAAPRRGR